MMTRATAPRLISLVCRRLYSHVRTAGESPMSWATAEVGRYGSMQAAVPSAPISLSHLTRRPQDSFLSLQLPFASDAQLREAYLSFEGQLRVGKLLEDIDAFAGAIAHRHCRVGEDAAQPMLMTVSTDRVDLLQYPLHPQQDLVMRGCVAHVGSSSLGVEIDVAGAGGAVLLRASLTMVARQPGGQGALAVPRLAASTPAEAALCAAGARASEARRAARQVAMARAPPTSEELQMVHTLWHERGASPPHEAARAPLVSTELTQPTDKNVNGHIFGGWLMRKAYETAWAAGWQATGSPPQFLAMDDVLFASPVELGSLLSFTGSLTFAPGAPHRTYGITVVVTMSRRGAPGTAAAPQLLPPIVTNTMHFTFHSGDLAFPPRMLPQSYSEAMAYIEAHRRDAAGRELAERRRSQGGARPRFSDEGVVGEGGQEGGDIV